MRSKTIFKYRILLIALIAMSGFNAVRAQFETAALLGAIRDQNGAAIEGAAVTLKNIDTGLQTSGVTDADGRVRARFLPLGPTYVDAIDAAGRRASALLEVERGRVASATIRVPGN